MDNNWIKKLNAFNFCGKTFLSLWMMKEEERLPATWLWNIVTLIVILLLRASSCHYNLSNSSSWSVSLNLVRRFSSAHAAINAWNSVLLHFEGYAMWKTRKSKLFFVFCCLFVYAIFYKTSRQYIGMRFRVVFIVTP